MLSATALRKIDREVAKYPPDRKQSAVMAALIIAQDEHGWLANETLDFVAQYLGMAPVAVYEVASAASGDAFSGVSPWPSGAVATKTS